MTLLKMSTMDGVAYIFDLLASDDKKEMFESGGLKEILEDEEIIKVCAKNLKNSCLIGALLL